MRKPNDGSPLRRRRARRGSSWLIAGVVSLLAVGLVVLSAFEVVGLEHRAAGRMQAEVALADTAREVDSVRYFPSGLVMGATSFEQASAIEQDLQQAEQSAAARLAGLSPLGRPIEMLLPQLDTAMDRELGMASAHHLRRAQGFDDLVVAPLYERLVDTEGRTDAALVNQSQAAGHNADLEVFVVVGGGGAIIVLSLVAFGISRRRRAVAAADAKALRESEERFRLLVHNSSDMITVLSEDGQVLYQAPSVQGVLGLAPEELENRPFADFVHPHAREHLAALLACAAQGGREELSMLHADGSWRPCEVRASALPADGGFLGIVLNIRDISERKTLEEELRHQAFHDSLTGLANRALFADRLEHALARQVRARGPLVVLLIDVDDFKAVNDSLGHSAGDGVLKEVAGRLRAAVRASDTVARLGGDEFAILLEEPSDVRAPALAAARIQAAFAEPFLVDERSLTIGTSIGAAVTANGTTAEELLRNADVAMYAAKAQGKGACTVFEAGMHAEIHKRLELQADLQQAIADGDQMELYYQPVVRLVDRAVVGMEALLRWNHPTHGLVAPLDFLPLAEESGLIIPLGHWVLHEACAQAARWQQAGPAHAELTMSVNVSARQLVDGELFRDVRAALSESGLPPGSLILEITETVLMRETKRTAEVLHQLQALGVRIAIDDFGTGYSSLGYLERLPVDVLKIDRSFISSIDDEHRKSPLTEAIVNIGAALALETIAEGIEDEGQLSTLRALDCRYGQGYLFGKPKPAAEYGLVLSQLAGGHALRPAA